jgi:hypothetical protein
MPSSWIVEAIDVLELASPISSFEIPPPLGEAAEPVAAPSA